MVCDQLGLDEDLRDELALYFLQLDIDKRKCASTLDTLDAKISLQIPFCVK